MRHPVVVITGGSRGIGRATAERFARRGSRLALVARDETALASAAERCRALGAAEVMTVSIDLAESDGSERAAEAVIDRFGRIDTWISAASVFSYGSVDETPDAVRDRVIATNLLGPMRDAKAVLPHFRVRGGGCLVFVGSLYSQVSSPDVVPYVAAKHGLLGFARAVRQEVRRERGIRVAIVLPASIDTAIYQRAANSTGRTPFPLPPVVSARRAARAIEVTRDVPFAGEIGARRTPAQGLSIIKPYT